MAQVNTVDLSEFQDPKEVDYQAMKDAGIKNLIIRSSVDLRMDHHAAEHIANAKKYGFNWHLYHYFYNDTNEADFAVKAAKSLGLGKDQILFLDMEDKSLPENWNEQFSIFRKAVGNSFKVGLYCSDSPYNAKFSDNQLKQLGVIRWIASYSYEPKNYDVWQKSGSGSGGFGTYTKDIDRDVDPNNILAISSSKPYVPTSEDKMVRQIILQPGYDTDTGIYGLGCSFDNGATFKVYWTIYGRKFYQEDADRLWPFLKNKITNAMSVDWDSIQNKPKFVTPDELEARLDKLSVPTVKWADIEDKPPIPSIDGLAKQSDLDNVKATADSAANKAEQAQSTADANTKALQNVYTKEESDQKYWTVEQEQDAESNLSTNIQELLDDKVNYDDVYTKSEIDSQNASNVKSVNSVKPDDQGNVDIDLTGYAKTSDIPKTMDWSQIIGKPNLALTSDIPSLDGYAKLTDIPSVTGLVKETELSDYVRKSDLPTMPDLSGYATISSLIDYVKKTDLPDFTLFAKKSDIPAEQDLSNYVKKPDLNNYVTNETYSHNETSLENTIENLQTSLNNQNQVQTITSGTLADLANKQGSYHYEIECLPSDTPIQEWGLCDVVVGQHYAKQVFTVTGATDDNQGNVYVRVRDYSGQWHEWRGLTLWN